MPFTLPAGVSDVQAEYIPTPPAISRLIGWLKTASVDEVALTILAAQHEMSSRGIKGKFTQERTGCRGNEHSWVGMTDGQRCYCGQLYLVAKEGPEGQPAFDIYDADGKVSD